MENFKKAYQEVKTPQEIDELIEKVDNNSLIKMNKLLNEYDLYFGLRVREEWLQNVIRCKLINKGDEITNE